MGVNAFNARRAYHGYLVIYQTNITLFCQGATCQMSQHVVMIFRGFLRTWSHQGTTVVVGLCVQRNGVFARV